MNLPKSLSSFLHFDVTCSNFARKNLMNNAYNYIYLKANSDEYSHASFAKQCLQLYLHLKANSYRSVHTLKKSSENHSDPKNNCC